MIPRSTPAPTLDADRGYAVSAERRTAYRTERFLLLKRPQIQLTG